MILCEEFSLIEWEYSEIFNIDVGMETEKWIEISKSGINKQTQWKRDD